jgi:hypothetical protein
MPTAPGDPKVITADQNAAINLAGVPPGDYKAYAWEDVEAGGYMDPEFMKPIERRVRRFRSRRGTRRIWR